MIADTEPIFLSGQRIKIIIIIYREREGEREFKVGTKGGGGVRGLTPPKNGEGEMMAFRCCQNYQVCSLLSVSPLFSLSLSLSLLCVTNLPQSIPHDAAFLLTSFTLSWDSKFEIKQSLFFVSNIRIVH